MTLIQILTILAPLVLAVETSDLNDRAVGTDGLSYGAYQITDICRRDINEIYGKMFTREDCFDRAKSAMMFELYLKHYCRASRLGHRPTTQDAARIWNGGPNGWKKQSTAKYWKKIEAEATGKAMTK